MVKPRVGFLGTGWIGRHRMEAALATGAIQAAAICDPSPECAAEAAKLAPDVPVLASLEALLEQDLDGLVIATPSALHAEQSIAALERGMAVFCQKPLGRNAAEAQAVVDAARKADRLLSVDFSYRYTAAAQAIAGRVRSGELGQLFAADLVFHNAYGPDKPWFYDRAQSGGGCVMDLGVHLVDLLLWLLDFPEVTDVSSTLLAGGNPLSADGVEDYAQAQLTLANGLVARLACSWRLQAGQEAVIEASLYGTGGGVSLHNLGGSFYDFEARRLVGTSSEVLVSPPDAWGGRAAAAWAEQLAQDRSFDPSAERLVDVAKVLDRIYAG
ncbi:putative dehydrogenase [Novosphingobium chloroacetimidivorans]|uniref:Putative dehydrogenase n=1 Tax=Novosphingobium chloroacetimidivorans TaxID=1428314 RepID=A0A7W7NWA2_9SPHN|nr:Gfo/Idh/MocA family oxidoreductase [Novosphingobium chloroacetimidivorans]MBB4859343.1 putative dehydrogenase [Novosphingobium chloroacetimidivorans]